jgi:uncharacterized protein (DUF2236 family)
MGRHRDRGAFERFRRSYRAFPSHIQDHVHHGFRHARPSCRRGAAIALASRQNHRRHADYGGPFAAGWRYFANETSALHWVHATLVETALITRDLVLPALSAEERERYYAESRGFAALFGIPQPNVPPTWEEFTGYNEAMWASDTLTVIPHARAIAEQVLRGSQLGFRAPKWYRAVTAGLLHPGLRRDFGLPYDEAEQRLAIRVLHWIRSIYPALPGSLRYVGPYQEAVGRLSGKARPSLLIQCSNRFWIGQSALGW